VSVPETACELFGSEPPPAEPGQAAPRPVDADATGGYYQPIRLDLEDSPSLSFAQLRVRCALASAPAEIVRQFARSYTPNENPSIGQLRFEGEATQVAPGQRIAVMTEVASASFEEYLYYNRRSRELEPRSELVQVAWFVTGGDLDRERLIIEAPGEDVSVLWTAPESSGSVWLWAVLRDDRGGVDFATLQIDVR
jgi:hypothetical protein